MKPHPMPSGTTRPGRYVAGIASCRETVRATQALRYDPIPGAYVGSVKLGPSDRSWAL